MARLGMEAVWMSVAYEEFMSEDDDQETVTVEV